MKIALILVYGLLLLGLGAIASGQDRGGEAGTRAQDKSVKEAVVTIDNFSFTPATITVAAGTTVHWTNHDDMPHTVTSDKDVFKSKALDTDQDFSYTFVQPGTYSYFCSIHPKMIGKVVVQ